MDLKIAQKIGGNIVLQKWKKSAIRNECKHYQCLQDYLNQFTKSNASLFENTFKKISKGFEQ